MLCLAEPGVAHPRFDLARGVGLPAGRDEELERREPGGGPGRGAPDVPGELIHHDQKKVPSDRSGMSLGVGTDWPDPGSLVRCLIEGLVCC